MDIKDLVKIEYDFVNRTERAQVVFVYESEPNIVRFFTQPQFQKYINTEYKDVFLYDVLTKYIGLSGVLYTLSGFKEYIKTLDDNSLNKVFEIVLQHTDNLYHGKSHRYKMFQKAMMILCNEFLVRHKNENK